jgi:cytochrome P450
MRAFDTTKNFLLAITRGVMTDLLTPPMPPLAPDNVGGLGVLTRLRTNGMTAFPARCLTTPVIRLKTPGRALVLASAPESVSQVLQVQAEHYQRLPAGRRILGPIVGRGLLVSEGETWRRQRRVMAPAFTPRTIPVVADHIMRCAATGCARLEELSSEPVDLLSVLQRLTLDIAAATMFSMDAGAFATGLRQLLATYMATIGRPAPSDFLLPAAVPTLRGLRRVLFRRRWLRLINGIIATRRAQPATGAARDLFDLMADAHGTDAPDLLADEVATMIVAGHETTALALFWACLLLAQSPAWQTAIAAETSGLDLSPENAAAALPALRTTTAVVQETLRLYPPAFMTARLATRAHDLCGVDVPANAFILIPLWLMHRNPQTWSAPDSFDPGRFLTGPPPDRFTYLPFGAGPHVCIGAQLAMTEAVLVLARLIKQFDMTLATNRSVLPIGLISTRPNHFPLFNIRKR